MTYSYLCDIINMENIASLRTIAGDDVFRVISR